MWPRLILLLGLSFHVGFSLYSPTSLAQEKDKLMSEVIKPAIPTAAMVGQGMLSYAFWDIYTATLYAPDGVWNAAKPFALSLEYYRSINSKDIADRSVQEMRKQGFSNEVTLAAWNAQMKTIFPNVKKGTQLTAIYQPAQETIFYNGITPIGVIKGDEFGQWFFAIWLAEKTSEPTLRRALLGLP